MEPLIVLVLVTAGKISLRIIRNCIVCSLLMMFDKFIHSSTRTWKEWLMDNRNWSSSPTALSFYEVSRCGMLTLCKRCNVYETLRVPWWILSRGKIKLLTSLIFMKFFIMHAKTASSLENLRTKMRYHVIKIFSEPLIICGSGNDSVGSVDQWWVILFEGG